MHEHLENKGFRHTLAAAGFSVCLIFLLASAVANFRYAFSLARTPFDGYLYGSAAAASDFFMAAAPFYYRASVDAKKYMPAAAAVFIWLVTTLFAAQAVVSHASANRVDAASTRITKSITFQDTRTELMEARKSRGFIPAHRDEAVVRAEISKAKIDRMWVGSNECTDPSGKAARTYCSGIETLNVELGYAMQASKLDARIAALVEKSDKAAESNPSVGMVEGDSGAKSWSVISGLDERTVQTAMAFIMAFVILTGAGIGPYMVAPTIYKPRPKIITLEAETFPPAPPDAPKLEPAKAPLLLPKPPEAIPLRAEPSPEWRALLDAIDFPKKKMLREPRRPQDERAKLGWRFFTWLCANGHSGMINTDDLDHLYDVYAMADHREQWSTRISKAELTEIKWVKKDDAVPTPNGPKKTTTVYTITVPAIDRLREQLVKRKVISENAPESTPAEPEPEARSSVISFRSRIWGRA